MRNANTDLAKQVQLLFSDMVLYFTPVVVVQWDPEAASTLAVTAMNLRRQ